MIQDSIPNSLSDSVNESHDSRAFLVSHETLPQCGSKVMLYFSRDADVLSLIFRVIMSPEHVFQLHVCTTVRRLATGEPYVGNSN